MMPRKYAVRMVETHLSLGPRTDPFTKSLAVLWTFCKSAAKCQQSTLLARLGNPIQHCGITCGTCCERCCLDNMTYNLQQKVKEEIEKVKEGQSERNIVQLQTILMELQASRIQKNIILFDAKEMR